MRTVDTTQECKEPLTKGTADMAPTSTNLFKVEEAKWCSYGDIFIGRAP
jgi:hypothetical protein